MIKFWTVQRSTNMQNNPGKFRHASLIDAVDEAERLAVEHKTPFYVMQCVGVCKLKHSPVEFEKAIDPSGNCECEDIKENNVLGGWDCLLCGKHLTEKKG